MYHVWWTVLSVSAAGVLICVDWFPVVIMKCVKPWHTVVWTYEQLNTAECVTFDCIPWSHERNLCIWQVKSCGNNVEWHITKIATSPAMAENARSTKIRTGPVQCFPAETMFSRHVFCLSWLEILIVFAP